MGFPHFIVLSLCRLRTKNKMQEILGTRVVVSLNQVAECNTLGLLASRIHEIISGTYGGDEDIVPLVQADEVLPSDIYISADKPCNSKSCTSRTFEDQNVLDAILLI